MCGSFLRELKLLLNFMEFGGLSQTFLILHCCGFAGQAFFWGRSPSVGIVDG